MRNIDNFDIICRAGKVSNVGDYGDMRNVDNFGIFGINNFGTVGIDNFGIVGKAGKELVMLVL